VSGRVWDSAFASVPQAGRTDQDRLQAGAARGGVPGVCNSGLTQQPEEWPAAGRHPVRVKRQNV